MLPSSLRSHIETLLDTRITHVKRASGGSINQAGVLECRNNARYFLKWNHTAPDDMFAKEQAGLQLLKTGSRELIIPEVLEAGEHKGVHFLLMEYLEEGRPSPESAEIFGEQLAALHSFTGEQYGLDHDNYIGRLPQYNRQHENWLSFFREQRLMPQIRMAADAGKLQDRDRKQFETLIRKLPELLPEEPPSLLHGDLWGGNFFYTAEGLPAVFDPAVYYGNREIELAFTHLFGGFTTDFYRMYEATWPLQVGFQSRKDIYNLYPLLVHVNLFGGSYVQQVRAIINRFNS